MNSNVLRAYSAIFVVFAIFLVNISEVYSNESVYIRYARKRPSWFPGDMYMEEIVEEFATIKKPPIFGSSELEIQNFLEADQNSNGTLIKPIREEYQAIASSSNNSRPTNGSLKPSITVTIYQPSDPVMEFHEVDVPSSEFTEKNTTTSETPYTTLMERLGEIDYYDTNEDNNWFKTTATARSTSAPETKTTVSTTTSKPFVYSGFTWFGKNTTASAPATTTSSYNFSPYSLFGRTSTISPSTTTIQEYTNQFENDNISTTTSKTFGFPSFSLFGKTTFPPTRNQFNNDNISPMPSILNSTITNLSSETDGFNATEIDDFNLTSTPDSIELNTDSTESYGTYESNEAIAESSTRNPTTNLTTTVKSTSSSFDKDYVNGEVVDSIEEEEEDEELSGTTTMQSNRADTTTKKRGLFTWLG